ncbi:hypothetical protein BSY19_1040 [Bosea sp. RAC05]|nr:hypothetical protein BSY19_1040 [Bosea sp. RAC05]
MSMTELGFAVAMAAVPLSKLLDLDLAVRRTLNEQAVLLVRSLGSFTVLNYEELLQSAMEKHAADECSEGKMENH